MGSGRSRSNNSIVSAGRQIVEAGSPTISCVIDQDILANTESVPDAVGRVGSVVVAEDGTVWLDLAGHRIPLLADDLADRLRPCIDRGYRFVGVVVAPGLVRVCND